MLFFRRHWKLYSKLFFYTLLSLLVVTTPAIGGAIFDKITVANFLNAQNNDHEISYDLELDYTANNISELKASINNLSNYCMHWSKYYSNYSLLLISDFKVNNLTIKIGIDFSEDSINLKKANFPLSQFEYFNNTILLENFLESSELPFDVSLVYSNEYFQNLNLTTLEIMSKESYVGQVFDIKIKKISSLESYLKFIEEINSKIEVYLSSNSIPLDISIKKSVIPNEDIILYKNQFDSLIILVTLIMLILIIWLNEFFYDNFTKDMRRKINKLFIRGLEPRREKLISVYLPLIASLFSFLFVGIVLLVTNFIIKLDFLLTIIILSIYSILFIYRNYRKFNLAGQTILNSKSTILFLFILLIVSITPILLKEFIYALIPDTIYSYLILFSQIIQYFIITLLIVEIFIKKIATRLFNKFGIKNLFSKLFNKKEYAFRQLIHTTLLLTWGCTVVTGGFQTFSLNYNLNSEMEYPTDLVISTDIYLFNISNIQNKDLISTVLPITHTPENFFLNYDLYLMNFTVVQELIPNLDKYYSLTDLKEGISYMSKDFAKEFDYVDGDYFLTKMGENSSSVYVNQEIRIIDYFPFVKKSDNRPFIVSSYNLYYSNISKVSKLYLNIKDETNKIEVLNYLENQLDAPIQEINEPYFANYNVFSRIFQAYFLLISLAVIWLCIKQILAEIRDPLKVFYLRGMSIGLIKKRQFNNLALLLIGSALLGVSLGILYLYLQLPTAIYPITQYYPIQILFWFSLLLIPIIPIIYGLNIITQRKSFLAIKTS